MYKLMSRPGASDGIYPQRSNESPDPLEDAVELFWRAWRSRCGLVGYSKKRVIREVNRYHAELEACSDAQLDQAIEQLRGELRLQGITRPLVFKSFAIIREISYRVLGKRHYDVQLYGGWIMMNGAIAEMATGEGKTLTTILPACTAALGGIPVHVITANDYLAERDAELMQPLYQRLGLNVASVVDGMSTEARRSAYRSDIVHTTSKQVAFDYLRDRVEMGDMNGPLTSQAQVIGRRAQQSEESPYLLPGLCFALIDEADSVLIDEAKTPLILSRSLPNDEQTSTYADALFLASSLSEGEDFVIHSASRRVDFRISGLKDLEELAGELADVWKNRAKRETLVRMALQALHVYRRDSDYIIQDGKIVIVDAYTGRTMADRSWEQGLHQMIEAKEGCLISEGKETLARISYQRFFRSYLYMSGTTGTAREAKPEFTSVYGLNVIAVPTHTPCKRKMHHTRIYAREADMQSSFIEIVEQYFKLKRPVLIGTRSVEQSEEVSDWLSLAELPHRVLNAKQDHAEADVIAKAGRMFAITVATNMAGRGTDIALGPGLEPIGGLHVISLAMSESARIDRQLFGRCARQGDPGSAGLMTSLEDPEIAKFYSTAMLSLLVRFCISKRHLPPIFSQWLVSLAQRSNEKKHRRVRRQLLRQDRELRKAMAFSGSE